MRKIKFRAWHKEKARYYEVDEIYFSMQRLAIKGNMHTKGVEIDD